MFLSPTQIIPNELAASVPELHVSNAVCFRQVSTVTQYGTRTDDCAVFNVGGSCVLVCRDLEMVNYDIEAGYVRVIQSTSQDLPNGVIHLNDSTDGVRMVSFSESNDYDRGRLTPPITQDIYRLLNQ